MPLTEQNRTEQTLYSTYTCIHRRVIMQYKQFMYVILAVTKRKEKKKECKDGMKGKKRRMYTLSLIFGVNLIDK